MDKGTRKEVIKTVKWFLKQPMFMWLGFSMILLFTESIFSDNPNYPWITLGFAIGYIFCMGMFMRSLEKSRRKWNKDFESKNTEFIRNAFNRGEGRITYILPDGKPEGFIRKLRMKLFGTKYICPYVASFIDTGIEHAKAYARFPVSKRQMFQLKLMGCYKTEDRERAVKALEFLGVDWPLP